MSDINSNLNPSRQGRDSSPGTSSPAESTPQRTYADVTGRSKTERYVQPSSPSSVVRDNLDKPKHSPEDDIGVKLKTIDSLMAQILAIRAELGGAIKDAEPIEVGKTSDGINLQRHDSPLRENEKLQELHTFISEAPTEAMVKPVVVQTLSSEAPKLPIIPDLTDKSFMQLKYSYEEYVLECQEQNIQPLTIDHCIRNDRKKGGSLNRDHFFYGLLNQGIEKSPHVKADMVYSRIRQVERRFAEEKADNMITDLGRILSDNNCWDLRILEIDVRVGILSSTLQMHLKEYGCQHMWTEYEKRARVKMNPEKDLEEGCVKEWRTNLSSKVGKGIVKEILKIIRPDVLRKYLKIKLARSVECEANPVMFLQILAEWAEKNQYHFKLHLVTQEAEKGNSGSSSKNKEKKKRRETQARSAGVSKSTTRTKPKCSGCGEEGHYFLKRGKNSDEYVKNCKKFFEAKEWIKLRNAELEKIKKLKFNRNNPSKSTYKAKQATEEQDRWAQWEAQMVKMNKFMKKHKANKVKYESSEEELSE